MLARFSSVITIILLSAFIEPAEQQMTGCGTLLTNQSMLSNSDFENLWTATWWSDKLMAKATAINASISGPLKLMPSMAVAVRHKAVMWAKSPFEALADFQIVANIAVEPGAYSQLKFIIANEDAINDHTANAPPVPAALFPIFNDSASNWFQVAAESNNSRDVFNVYLNNLPQQTVEIALPQYYMRQNVTYLLRVSNNGEKLSIVTCIYNETTCITVASNVTLTPSLLSFRQKGPVRFGIGVVTTSSGTSAEVTVAEVSVYNCSQEIAASTTTKPASTLTTTSKTETTPSRPTTTTTTTTMKTDSSTISPLIDSTDSTAFELKIAAAGQTGSQQMQSFFPQDLTDTWANITAKELLQQCSDFAPEKSAPPPNSYTGAVTIVKPIFGVDELVEISTADEFISLKGTLMFAWNVTTCPAQSYDLFTRRSPEQVYVASSTDVWTPKFRYLERQSPEMLTQYGDELIATMSTDATISKGNRTLNFYWLKEAIFRSACDLDLAKFPFDTQTCLFSFALLRSKNVVKFKDPVFYWDDGATNGNEWRYISRQTSLGTLRHAGMPTSVVFFAVTFRRNPLYYVMNFVLPCCLLEIVQFGSMMIPPQMPDRPTFSMSVLLALTVTQSAVSGEVPKTSQQILLVDYVSALTWICAGGTLYQLAMCLYAAYRRNAKKKQQSGDHSNGPSRRIPLVRCFDILVLLLQCAAMGAVHIYAYRLIFV